MLGAEICDSGRLEAGAQESIPPGASPSIFPYSPVKTGIKRIEIPAVQCILHTLQRLSEALEVHDLALAQEADGRDHVRVVHEAQDVVVGGAGLLLCCNHTRTNFDGKKAL